MPASAHANAPAEPKIMNKSFLALYVLMPSVFGFARSEPFFKAMWPQHHSRVLAEAHFVR